MTIFTQRNALYVGAVAGGWAAAQGMGLVQYIMSDKISHWIEFILVFVAAAFARAGFNFTPIGNTIPYDVLSGVDRRAAITKAGDAVVTAAAATVVAEAEAVTKQATEQAEQLATTATIPTQVQPHLMAPIDPSIK